LYNRITVVFILVFVLLLIGCKEETESYYSRQQFKIDGMLDEWTNHPLLTIDEQPVSLGIRNDDDNLYFMVATRSEQMIRTFQFHGLTLWLNSDNKKKKEFGIVVYPDFDLPERDEPNMMEKGISSEMLEKMKQKREKMKGKSEIIIKSNRITLTSDEGTIATGYAFYKGVYLIELKIPFQAYDLHDNSYTFQPESIVSAGFMSGMNRDEMRNVMKNREFGDRGISSGFPDEGIGGRGGMGGNTHDMYEQRPIQFNHLELWLSIKLAKTDI